jgi:hypothetical protein
MYPTSYEMNQMRIAELARAIQMERLAQQASDTNSVISAYLSAHLLIPLGRKLIQSGSVLLEMGDGAAEQIR